jgi:cytosine/adenosine deaminase-related metal-dependent hydrolase
MSTLLIKHAEILVTMDDHRREIADGGLFCRDGFIEKVGKTSELPAEADEVLNARGQVVMPGLINTHHHFYQTLTRAVPAAQDANLFNWLKTLYPIWAGLTPEDIYISTQTALAELALSGCTAASDHLYIYPNGCRLDDEINAAREIGVRLQASRGSMSLGESKGGLPPDRVVEDEEFILKESQRLIKEYHDPNPGAMTQIVLAPCSPFSVTADLMRQSAALAREYGVHLHTHLAETQDEEAFCLEAFGYRPVAYMDVLNWTGNDVWFAHSVHVNQGEIALYARTGCGVDGSASNDGAHLLGEVRQAMLAARVRAGMMGASLSGEEAPPIMTARQALEIATRGSAAVLGRSDLGSLEAGKCADFFTVRMDKLGFAGALHDPVAALVFCAPVQVDNTIIGGSYVVKDGQIVTIDLPRLIEKHNRAARRLVNGE